MATLVGRDTGISGGGYDGTNVPLEGDSPSFGESERRGASLVSVTLCLFFFPGVTTRDMASVCSGPGTTVEGGGGDEYPDGEPAVP